LTINQIPSHSHSVNDTIGNIANQTAGGNNPVVQSINRQTRTTTNAGNGGSHNHGHNLSGSLTGEPGVGNLGASLSSSTASINVQYVDVIFASKD
jgi:hypothetical protein